MNASQALIVIAVFLVVAAAMAMVMRRMNRIARQRNERRRAAWEAEGGVGPCPGEHTSGFDFNTHFNGNYF